MSLRGLLVALVVAATAAFVVGVALERGSKSDHHDTAAPGAPAGEATGEGGEAGGAGGAGEGAHDQAEAGASKTAETSAEELRPLGIDVEAWPFVALAAVASLALAAAAALRPQSVPLLTLLAVALLAFAVLDVREVAHQLDEKRTDLAVLAGAVALLHLAAAAVACVMVSRARTDGETVGPAGTMAA
jgi:hypothetical protein